MGGVNIKLLKYFWRRITCKHRYKCVCKISARDTSKDKRFVDNYLFKCVKCGKEIDIYMDKNHQFNEEVIDMTAN